MAFARAGPMPGSSRSSSSRQVAIATRAGHALTASHDGTARVWSTEDGRPVSVFTSDRELTAAAWLDEHTAAIGGFDGSVRTIDTRTGKVLSSHAVEPDDVSQNQPGAHRGT